MDDSFLASLTVCIVSGGTGGNSLVHSSLEKASSVSYILPISDDGGSAGEIQRVVGGPSVGDLRSRLVRLIPDAAPGTPRAAIKRLLEYRLSEDASADMVKSEWRRIVEGSHYLWKGIPADRKEAIRNFLVYTDLALLKKASKGFNWKKASIGNLFLTGCSQMLGGSIQSAIFLFAAITDIPHERLKVIPVINTSSSATIAAQLVDGTVIVGQSEISHPSSSAPPTAAGVVPSYLRPATPARSGAVTPSLFEGPILGDEEDSDLESVESLPRSDYGDAEKRDRQERKERERNRTLVFSKSRAEEMQLQARIERLMYLNAYGLETFPKPNPRYIEALGTADCLIYSCGSLYTSIIPCLALRTVGTAISSSPTLRYKVLLLNSKPDRETPGYDATEFVKSIWEALSREYGETEFGSPIRRLNEFITHIAYLEGGRIPVDEDYLRTQEIACIKVQPSLDRVNNSPVNRASQGAPMWDGETMLDALRQIIQRPVAAQQEESEQWEAG